MVALRNLVYVHGSYHVCRWPWHGLVVMRMHSRKGGVNSTLTRPTTHVHRSTTPAQKGGSTRPPWLGPALALSGHAFAPAL